LKFTRTSFVWRNKKEDDEGRGCKERIQQQNKGKRERMKRRRALGKGKKRQ